MNDRENELLDKQESLLEKIDFLKLQVGFWRFVASVAIAGNVLVGILMILGDWPWRT